MDAREDGYGIYFRVNNLNKTSSADHYTDSIVGVEPIWVPQPLF